MLACASASMKGSRRRGLQCSTSSALFSASGSDPAGKSSPGPEASELWPSHGAPAAELLGGPIRITEIAPGMVETEFSLVRFGGDEQRAAEVYRGIDPLAADDVAKVIAFILERAENVNIDYVAVKPVAQATATASHRRE